MTGELFYTVFDTAAGWIAVLGSPAGLRRVTLPVKSRHEASEQPGFDICQAKESRHFFQDTIERLVSYFSGNKVDFPEKLDLTGATDFQREVWRATLSIPYGETRSYGWVAGRINRPKAPRAVGQALGRNPLPVIIPCHRVLSGDGSLGGFTGGLEMKRFLLGIERRGMGSGLA